MPNDQIPKINFNAPNEEKGKIKDIEKKLENLREEYSNIINPSIKKKIVGKIIPSKKKEYKASKVKLEEELQRYKKELKKLKKNYDRDKEFCNDIKRLIQHIDAYCYNAGIKKIDIKLTREETISFADEIENRLKIINLSLKPLEENMKKVRKFKENGNPVREIGKQKKELRALIESAKTYEIDILEGEKLVKTKSSGNILLTQKKCESKQNTFKNLIDRHNTILTNLQKENCNFKNVNEKLEKLFKELTVFCKDISEFTEEIDQILKQSDINSLKENIKKESEELKKKIKFAEELKEYKVFDANMGVGKVENALKPLTELQKTTYGKNILCESQPCLEIAQGKKEMEKQYDHSQDWGNNGPCYIVVDESSKKVSEAYSYTGSILNGNKTTINASGKQPQAENEVKNYLMHALQNGEFKNDVNWLKPYKKGK